jgi:4'-phosphopantetheinyl transferase
MPAGLTYTVAIVEGFADGAVPESRPLLPTDIVLAIARPEQSAAPERYARLLPLLSADERARLERFRFERDRLLFLVAHALLRITLSRCSDVAPEAWQFGAGSHGRPEIAAPASRMRFSLSHTQGLAACAVVLDRDIGVDVESLSRETAVDVAERFFSPREVRELRETPIDDRHGRFLEYWTMKEAYVKARGLGLSLPLDRFSVYNSRHGDWRISFEPPLNDDPARWWLWSSRVGSTHQAALAIG